MLIDWLTLRIPLESFSSSLVERIEACKGRICQISPDGEILWQKVTVDWDTLRSDAQGLYWSITAGPDKTKPQIFSQEDGKLFHPNCCFLSFGGSPASVLHDGVNVFGSDCLQTCAELLIAQASKSLGCILPNWRAWDCRRIDVTANYDMGNSAQVKQALRLLLATDAPRRRTNSDRRGGDTVYWNPSSTLRSGKAYHKGAHLRYQQKRGAIDIHNPDFFDLADRLLRLELKLGSAWFRQTLKKDWHDLTKDDLATEHLTFFSSLIGGGDVEVSDMGILLQELEKHAPTKGRALSAHRTWSLIKTIGYTQAQSSMPRSTFALHMKYLRAAGLSSADLCAGNVIPFRRKSLIISSPVTSWEELRRVA